MGILSLTPLGVSEITVSIFRVKSRMEELCFCFCGLQLMRLNSTKLSLWHLSTDTYFMYIKKCLVQLAKNF